MASAAPAGAIRAETTFRRGAMPRESIFSFQEMLGSAKSLCSGRQRIAFAPKFFKPSAELSVQLARAIAHCSDEARRHGHEHRHRSMVPLQLGA